jgi:FkbM family methyltransferase
MLIPFQELMKYITSVHLPEVTGILHVGAHNCEEKEQYNKQGIQDAHIFWVEGMEDKVTLMKERGIPHIYHALVDKEEHDVEFYITNNGQSSSILPLETHLQQYPMIKVVETRKAKTTTLHSLIEKEAIPIQKCNFWNLDIQGTELYALIGAKDYINHADYIYIEVNLEHLYKDCPLLPEIDEFLQAKGFVRMASKMVRQGWGDAFYVRAQPN